MSITLSPSQVTELLAEFEFAWFGQRALDCVGLDQYCNIPLVLCCDYGLDTASLSSNKRIISIERHSYERERWSSADLNRIISTNSSELTAFLQTRQKPLHVIAYSSSQSLFDFVRSHPEDIKALMPHPQLKHFLDNKLHLRRVFDRLGLPSIPSQVIRANNLSYSELRADWGHPFVIQLPFGSSGSGTFFCFQEQDLSTIDLSSSDYVLVSKYINGVSLNVNAAVLGNRTVLSYPSLQLVGLPECSKHPEVYCGNDFSAAQGLGAEVITRAKNLTLAIGNWLNRIGYEGMFGLDLIVDLANEVVYPVELNPRFQNSTHLLTQIAIRSGHIPLPLLNLGWHLGIMTESDIIDWQEENFVPLDGSQVIIYSHKAGVVNGLFEPGIYMCNADSVEKKRDGITLLDSTTDTEFVVSCGVPRQKTHVLLDAPVLKILSTRGVYDVKNNQLTSQIKLMCDSITRQLRIS